MNVIKPIRTEHEYEAAVEEIDELMEAEEGTPAADRLEVLAILVDAYEEAHDPIAPPDPIEAILFALDQGQITKKDLELALGGRNRMSEVLSRRRGLSINMIRVLAKMGLPAESLIGESSLKRPKKAARTSKPKPRTKGLSRNLSEDLFARGQFVHGRDGRLASEQGVTYNKPRSRGAKPRQKSTTSKQTNRRARFKPKA